MLNLKKVLYKLLLDYILLQSLNISVKVYIKYKAP